MHKRFLSSMSVLAMVAAGAAAGASTASAGQAQPAVVSAKPATFTPNLAPDDTIGHPAAYAVEQSTDGSTMYLGGQFHSVQDSTRTTTLVRQNFMAFNSRTGAISDLAPSFNGNVWAIRSVGTSIYVAGEFTTVNGVVRRGLVKLSAATGAVDPTFKAPWKFGKAYDLQVVSGRVIVGGTFAGALLALNPTTGADTGYLHVGVAGSMVPTGGANEPTHVYRLAVNTAGTRLVAIGNFSAPHARAFMVDLGATATLDPWYYGHFADYCILPKTYPAYLRDVDFSPDGSYFVIVGTGGVAPKGSVGVDICDAAARFETDGARSPTTNGPNSPTWINYTGGDTLHSVVVTGVAVYVQGHQRYLNNPAGHDTCVTTCVSRPGIGAIDPSTGFALAWNPTKTRNVGGKDLLATSQGLWVASDGMNMNYKYHYGIALMPLP